MDLRRDVRRGAAALVIALVFGSVPGAFAEDRPFGTFLIKQSDDPAASAWRPTGQRLASREELRSRVLPNTDRFTTLHGTIRNAEEVSIAFASVFEQGFTVEERAYLPEGPTFLKDGTILITPLLFSTAPNSTTNHVVIALDGESGERVWAIDGGQFGQGGAPLVLDDPDAQREIVYVGGLESILAVDGATGDILWQTATGLPETLAAEGVEPTVGTGHLYGVSYHPPTDSILTQYGLGIVQAFDRQTGALLGGIDLRVAANAKPTPPPSTNPGVASLIAAAEPIFAATYDGPAGENNVQLLFEALLGNNNIVANYFTVDPDRGSIYVAATLEDGHEGDSIPGDGFSEDGALYRIELDRSDDQAFFSIACRAAFKGGSASTPVVSADGARIYTADNFNHVLAFDRGCEEVFRTDVGAQVFGSLSVSSTGGEIYAANAGGVFKLQQNEDRTSAEVVFNADLASAYISIQTNPAIQGLVQLVRAIIDVEAELRVVNLNLASLGENGMMVQSALALFVPSINIDLPLVTAMSLVDRETGQVINSAPAREETVSALSVSPDGTTVIGNSPFRRLLLLALLEQAKASLEPDQWFLRKLTDKSTSVLPPLTGGVTKYNVAGRYDLLARDAACAASYRLDNVEAYQSAGTRLGVRADKKDSRRLVRQAIRTVREARQSGDISNADRIRLIGQLRDVLGLIKDDHVGAAAWELGLLCDELSG